VKLKQNHINHSSWYLKIYKLEPIIWNHASILYEKNYSLDNSKQKQLEWFSPNKQDTIFNKIKSQDFTCNGQFTHSQTHYNKVSFPKVLFSWDFDHFVLLKPNTALPILVPLLAIWSKEAPFLLYALVMKKKKGCNIIVNIQTS